MENLKELHEFLKKHGDFNRNVQNGYYRQCLLTYDNNSDRTLSLLFSIVNTQSQPKLDLLAEFWRKIYTIKPENLSSLDNFIEALKELYFPKAKSKFDNLGSLDQLFQLLRSIRGWGDKTAALFVKSCCNIHWDEKNEKIRFWEDFPSNDKDNKLYLPVDRVIIHIFSLLKIDGLARNGNQFNAINNYFQSTIKNPNEMLIWDDLWFWGFITQKTENKVRKLVWNPSKYYAIFHAPKDIKSIEEIEKLSAEFIKIVSPQEIT